MKAAVLEALDITPVYKDFKDPIPESDQQQMLHVQAAPLKYLDKLMTKESFYGSYKDLPVVVGTDGVGLLDDGTRVYAQGITGMFAEKAIISNKNVVVIPDPLDVITAAAIPNAVQGSLLPLRVRGNMKKGDTVLINGATGFTGKMAVQAARHYGAEKIIVTGRDEDRLKQLLELGADHTISLTQSDDEIGNQLKELIHQTSIDIIIDYIWDKPAEIIIKALTESPGETIRFVNVGHMAGPNINLNAGAVRGSKIELLGAGLGSYTKNEFQRLISEFVPEMFELAAAGKLAVHTQVKPLKNIEKIWNQGIDSGERLVLTI